MIPVYVMECPSKEGDFLILLNIKSLGTTGEHDACVRRPHESK